MKTLHISVVDKIATYQKRDGDIVCGNSGYQIKFTFDGEWGAHTKKTARFIWNGQIFDKDFTGDTCDVPIVTKTKELQVGVFAGDLTTTTPAKIGCKPSILCGAGTPSVANDKHYANEAKEAAEKATQAAEAEVARLVGEIGISQSLGDSVTATVSQKVVTDTAHTLTKKTTPILFKDIFVNKTFGNGHFYVEPTRLAYEHILVFDYDVVISCEDGYQFEIDYFNDDLTYEGEYVSWRSEPYTIPAGNIFILLLRRVDCAYIYVSEHTNLKIHRVSDYHNLVNSGSAFMLPMGGFENKVSYQGALSGSSTRISYTEKGLCFDCDVVVRCADGYKLEVTYWADLAFTSQSGRKGSGWQTEYTIPKNNIALVTLAKSDDSAITPADYDKLTLTIGGLGVDYQASIEKQFEDRYTNSPILFSEFFANKSVGNGSFFGDTTRLAYTKALVFDHDIVVKCEDGYKYEIDYWADTNFTPIGEYVSWRSDPYTIPAGKVFTLLLRHNDNSNIDVSEYTKLKIYRALDFKGEEAETETQIDLTKNRAFAALFKDSGIVEPFLFFTDPHFIGTSAEGSFNHTEYLDIIKKHYDNSSAEFVLCGGDWLNANNTKDGACFMLSQIKGKMRERFDKHYLVVGNHDNNYQGISEVGAENYTGTLSQRTVNNLWYDGGKSYYTFTGSNTRFYVFDCGTDWRSTSALTEFDTEQINWFIESLNANDDAHIAFALHMVEIVTDDIHPITNRITEIARAYNARGSIEQNGVTYDFSNKTGTVEFVIAGHMHEDKSGVVNGIPYIATVNTTYADGYPSFDLVLADYTARTLKTVRVGSGEDRVIELNPSTNGDQEGGYYKQTGNLPNGDEVSY